MRPIRSLLDRLEEITRHTPPEAAEDHRNLLEARRILSTVLHLDNATQPLYAELRDKAVYRALMVYGKPPYPEFFGGGCMTHQQATHPTAP